METKDIISKIRKDNNLTQTQFGEILNCDRYRVADIERGKTTPTITDIKTISNKFNVSADYLLGLSDTKSIEPNIKMICEYTKLQDCAIENLKTIGTNALELLNFLIKYECFYSFLSSIYDYFHSDSAIMLVEKNEKECHEISLDDNLKQVFGLRLASGLKMIDCVETSGRNDLIKQALKYNVYEKLDLMRSEYIERKWEENLWHQ